MRHLGEHLEREIGVSYKTAWRMLNRIRTALMTQDDDEPLEADVEVDETASGRQDPRRDSRKGRQRVIAKMSRPPTIWEPSSAEAVCALRSSGRGAEEDQHSGLA